MSNIKYMQTDSRWGGLGYPKSPYFIRNCGCGEVSIANILVEFDTKYTPANIQPYCKQYADPKGNGTYHSGIPKMLKHYGLTEVKEHATMKPLWDELAKGNRVAVYLMGSRKGGSRKVHWTSSGHFICSVGYKYESGKHYVYVKDSYSNSSLRNGWITYEDNMKNDVLKVWSGKLPAPAPAPTNGKLVVDGIGGLATVNRLQEFLGVAKTDGITIRKDLQKYVPALKAYDYGNGSPTVKAMQKWLGLSNPDGLWGANTSKGLQKKLGVAQDGIAGANTFKALQMYLNENDKAVYPEQLKGEKIMDACKAQAEYMKSAKYGDYSPVTLTHSKTAGTCVTYEGCVFQRLGALSSGQYIWQNGNGYGTGKVTHLNNNTMTCTYMDNKTLSSLKGEIQKGDCILLDDNKSGVKGSGGHVFFCTGEWNGNDPYIWDFEASKTCAKTGKPRKYSGSRKVLAIVRLKEATSPASPTNTTNAQKLAEKANEFAYATNTKDATYPSGKPKASYKTALYKAYPNLKGKTSPASKGASCDVFVGVCVRSAGIDPNFPRGLSPSYLAKSNKFKLVGKSAVQNGDIIVTSKHICIAYGGKVKEASNGDFYPKTTNTLSKRLNASGAKVYRAK